jgi:hypothetical protein
VPVVNTRGVAGEGGCGDGMRYEYWGRGGEGMEGWGDNKRV